MYTSVWVYLLGNNIGANSYEKLSSLQRDEQKYKMFLWSIIINLLPKISVTTKELMLMSPIPFWFLAKITDHSRLIHIKDNMLKISSPLFLLL
jgi:hypothetical protein